MPPLEFDALSSSGTDSHRVFTRSFFGKTNAMSSLSEDLFRLHTLRLELEEVEEMLLSGPRRIAAQERVIAKKLEELEEQKRRITDLRKTADQKSLQLKSNEARIADLQAKLNAAASNREYEIISSQIKADSMANSVLEDEILEAFEKVDAALAALAEMEAALTEQKTRQQQTASEVAAAESGLQERAETLRAAIKQAEKSVPSKVADTYRRLVAAHGAAALASVDDGACSCCHNKVSRQESVALNLDKILMCRSCGRMLYRVDRPGD